MLMTQPSCPHLGQVDRIRAIVTDIRSELEGYLRIGVTQVQRQSDAPRTDHVGDPVLPWLLALYAHRYGAIYWVPRHEAARLTTTIADHAKAVDAAGEYLADSGTGNALFNFAVSCFVRSTRRTGRQSRRYTPPNGFQPTAADELTYRSEDFTELDPCTAVEPADARYDLHDFAHLTAARLCPQLYRSHLGCDLDPFPAHVADLVAGFTSAVQYPHADGVVFSDVLTPLFPDAPWPALPEPAVVDWLAEAITPYLTGEGYPPSAEGRPSRTLHPVELAVLAQNKAYEHPASEIERHVFVRGGRDDHDRLAALSPSDRLRAIALLTGRTWNEARNVLKHRAHRQAYRTVCSRMLLDQNWDPHLTALLAATLTHLDYTDYHDGSRRNLFQEAARLLAWAPATATTYLSDTR